MSNQIKEGEQERFTMNLMVYLPSCLDAGCCMFLSSVLTEIKLFSH